MSRKVEWTRSAAADVERLNRTMQQRVRQAVYRMVELGYGDVKRLQGRADEWRLRVGQWRVRFTRDQASGAVRILRVLPRGGAYRD